MKRAEKKPAVTLRTGEDIDDASVGGPYVSRYVRASVGKLKHCTKGKYVAPTGDGVQVYAQQYAEGNPNEVYLSVEIQRGRRPSNSDRRWIGEGSVSVAHLDSLIELLTLVRDEARESGIISPAA